MTDRLSLAQKMRAAHVKRWQVVRVAREQNIAEHMYRVWLVVGHMLDMMDPRYGTPMFAHQQQILHWALIHDQPEVVTGDLASPVKRAMRRAVPDQDPVKTIELSLDGEYRRVYRALKASCPEGLLLVKAADVIEAIDFLRLEAIGDHSVMLWRDLITTVDRITAEAIGSYPDYDWTVMASALSETAAVRASV